MAPFSSSEIKLIELSPVSPPPGSVPATSLPLTFLDIPWLPFPPSKPLFFYNFPISTTQFTRTILPNLRRSLSSTLHHFFSLAGKLVVPPEPNKPTIKYAEGDSVSLAVAESHGDFSYLSGDGNRELQYLHYLAPELPRGELVGEDVKEPVFAVKITVFPGCGICIGFALRHVVADGRTFDNFLKMWAYATRRNGGYEDLHLLPVTHDRSVITDPNGLESVLSKEWWKNKDSFIVTCSNFIQMVRSTFVLGPLEMEKIKKRILSTESTGSKQMLLSPYVLACAFIWVCWVKTHWPFNEGSEEIHYFGFIAGGLTRLSYPVPASYVGNCVAFGRLGAKRGDLMGANGIFHAAKAIGNAIKKLNGDVLGNARNWISEWTELLKSDFHVTVTGSPKVKLYSLDFGWGRPEKIEVSIYKIDAISLCESRNVVGGIEIGLTLPECKMDRFCSLFHKGINNLI